MRSEYEEAGGRGREETPSLPCCVVSCGVVSGAIPPIGEENLALRALSEELSELQFAVRNAELLRFGLQKADLRRQRLFRRGGGAPLANGETDRQSDQHQRDHCDRRDQRRVEHDQCHRTHTAPVCRHRPIPLPLHHSSQPMSVISRRRTGHSLHCTFLRSQAQPIRGLRRCRGPAVRPWGRITASRGTVVGLAACVVCAQHLRVFVQRRSRRWSCRRLAKALLASTG
jgi:hypothetical protein